ncbi:glycine-rich domain-containing protein [Streptomyces sp. NPDC003691]
MVESSAALRRGRDLVGPGLFERLAAFCAEEYGMERVVADAVMDQAMAFVYVVGSERAYDLAPSRLVDPGWHAFMLHTQEYADWCRNRFGFFVHHEPNSTVRTPDLMVSVAGRIRAAGFEVDERLWGTTAECNPPACCGDGPCC